MIQIGKIGKIIISNNIKNQIDYYHKQIQGKEWSGILFFKQIKGNIENLKDLEFLATNVYLMDIGSETFTKYNMDKEIVKAYDFIGDTNLESLTGMIHSHHNMQAFFSGTDIQELKDNASNYFFYISLIVNTSDKYVCKIVIPTKTNIKSEYLIRDNTGNIKKVFKTNETNELLDCDLEVVFENTLIVENWVKERIVLINESKKEKTQIIDKQLPFQNNFALDYSKPTIKPQQQKVETKSSIEKLAISILTLTDSTNIKIKEAVNEIDSLSIEDFQTYLYALSNNIDLLHDNVFPTTFFRFNSNIREVIKLLSEYKTNKPTNICDVIKYLESLLINYI